MDWMTLSSSNRTN